MLGSEAFKRRLMVLGAGARAARLRRWPRNARRGFVLVGYVAMNEANRVVEEAIARDAIKNLAEHVVMLNATEVVLALEERRNALPLKDLLRIKTTGRPRQRNLDLSGARDRPGRSRHRQPQLADLFRRLFGRGGCCRGAQAAVRHLGAA